MSRAPDLCPPIIANVEEEYVQFDFAQALASGVTITSISGGDLGVFCRSLDGSDVTPMARILSTPAIGATSS